MALNSTQAECFELAVNGHNLFITGQAGTGKTHLIRQIHSHCQKTKVTSIICTTGIATLNYKHLNATTLHHWFGILDGRYLTKDIINKILHEEKFVEVKYRILKTDILLMDEIGMLSKAIFNQCNEICKAVRQNRNPFGGIQVVATGSFKQLPPIANPRYLDDGKFCFESIYWPNLFPPSHCITLTEIHRTNDTNLIKIVQELEDSVPSSNTLDTLVKLQRPLPNNNLHDVTHLFATNEDVDTYNMDKLNAMPGPMFSYLAKDSNVSRYTSKSLRAKARLNLKIGVPVILLKNINIKKGLVNGARGIIKQMFTDKVIVDINSNQVTITNELFTVYDTIQKKTICSREQLPLALAFSLTIHRSQGMTLEHVQVDCSTIFCAGQLAVAIGRATHLDGLRVLNFSPALARMTHKKTVLAFCSSVSDHFNKTFFQQELSCCSNSKSIHTETEIPNDPPSRCLFPPVIAPALDTEHTLLPDLPIPDVSQLFTFNADSPNTELQSEMVFVYKNIKKSRNFITFWNTVLAHITKTANAMQAPVTKDWNIFCSQIHAFATSQNFQQLQKSMFEGIPCSSLVQQSLSYKCVEKIRELYLCQLAKPFLNDIEPAEHTFIDDSSKAVIRYVAGYTVASVRKSSHSAYARGANVSARTRWGILRDLTVPYNVITKSTNDPESFSEITRRTTASDGSGLTCVKDNVFDFFLSLYQICVEFMSKKNMDEYPCEIFTLSLRHVLQAEKLIEQWFTLTSATQSDSDQVDVDAEFNTNILLSLFEDICIKFLSVIFKDTRQKLADDKGKEKSSALRKRLNEKKPTNNSKTTDNKIKTGDNKKKIKRKQQTPDNCASTSQQTIDTVDIDVTSQEQCTKLFNSDLIDTLDDIEYPCGICGKDTDNCSDQSIECSTCLIWFHYLCSNIRGTEPFIVNEHMDYYCRDCDVTLCSKKRKRRKICK